MSFKSSFHRIIGTVLCRSQMLWWEIRDRLSPPKENAILFVAHPDDETLFFHSFINNYKPYVVLMTAGYSVNRLSCFRKAAKRYGIRFRAYDQHVDDTDEKKIYRRAKHLFSLGNFEICATHSKTGEYGHPVHISVHNAVCKAASCPVITPVEGASISQHPLSHDDIDDKISIFKTIYKSELFCLSEWPEWISNEGYIEH